MKIIKINLIVVTLICISIFNSCIVCNQISWYGDNVDGRINNKPHLYNPYLSIERNQKQIFIPPFIIYTNKKGYNLTLIIVDNYDKINKIDSIQATIFTNLNDSIDKFKFYNDSNLMKIDNSHFTFETSRKLNIPKKYLKNNMFVNLIIYNRFDSVGFQIKNCDLKRNNCRGIYLFPF